MNQLSKFTINCLVFIAIIMIIIIIFSGCSTISTQFGTSSGLGLRAGIVKYADPSQKVDPSQTAYRGADGHAAALALGDIVDPEARIDAKEAMIAISENSGLWGQTSRTRFNNGSSSVIAGTSGAFGRMYNPFEYPITVVITGLGSPYTFSPGEEQELLIPYGRYNIAVYNSASHQLMGHNHFDTNAKRKFGDQIYNFNVRLDAESAK